VPRYVPGIGNCAFAASSLDRAHKTTFKTTTASGAQSMLVQPCEEASRQSQLAPAIFVTLPSGVAPNSAEVRVFFQRMHDAVRATLKEHGCLLPDGFPTGDGEDIANCVFKAIHTITFPEVVSPRASEPPPPAWWRRVMCRA
jgi:hypothetical protein